MQYNCVLVMSGTSGSDSGSNTFGWVEYNLLLQQRGYFSVENRNNRTGTTADISSLLHNQNRRKNFIITDQSTKFVSEGKKFIIKKQ